MASAWEPKWEPKRELADSFCHVDHPEQIKLAAEFAQECSELGTIHMAKDNHVRQDAHKTKHRKTRELGEKGI